MAFIIQVLTPTLGRTSASLRFIFCLGLLTLLISGCMGVKTIDIEGSYPTPLVNKLPLTVGVYYAEELRNYSYLEIDQATSAEQYIVNSGSSQVALFNTILPALFEQVVLIEDINALADHANLDIIFVPAIDDFQVGLPQKTKLDSYEIWVKYNMRLLQADGDAIADWVMTAYGKAPTDTFQSVNAGLNDAANVALRDLAASFTLGFSRVPEVSDWLSNNDLLEAER